MSKGKGFSTGHLRPARAQLTDGMECFYDFISHLPVPHMAPGELHVLQAGQPRRELAGEEAQRAQRLLRAAARHRLVDALRQQEAVHKILSRGGGGW